MGLIRCQLILAILLISSIGLFAQAKKIKVFQGDSVLEYSLIYKNTDSTKQGRLLAYYTNDSSQLAYEKTYYLGRQSGTYKTYFPEGSLMEAVVYQNGKRHGDYTRYEEQGTIVIKAKYRNDQLHGFWIDRKKKIQGRYRNGMKQGKWEYNMKTVAYVKRYYDQGKLVDQTSFLRGIKIFNKKAEGKPVDIPMAQELKEQDQQYSFSDTMIVDDRGNFKVYKIKQVPRNSISHPSMYKAIFLDNPDQTAIVKYIYNGKLNGLFQKFYLNGNIYQYANYSYGHLDGKWKQYSENGDLIIRGVYMNGKKHGIWHYNIGLENYRREKFKNGENVK